MSKIGKKIIDIPDGVEVKLEDHTLAIKGPRGESSVSVDKNINAILDNGSVRFEPIGERLDKHTRSMWGTMAALTRNAISGVVSGFEKKLEIIGVGYKAVLEGETLVLSLGFSHPVKYNPPEGINITVEKNNITVSGNDKAVVGEVAAKIRAYKKPEPYKGKGIRYKGEVVRKKAGKKRTEAA